MPVTSAASGVVPSHVRRLVLSTAGLLTPTVACRPAQMWQDSPVKVQQLRLLLLLVQLQLQRVQHLNIKTDKPLAFCLGCPATGAICYDSVTTPGTTVVKDCCLSTEICKAVKGGQPSTCQAI
jgi:hypothetical protein